MDRQQRSKSDLKLECVTGNRSFRQEIASPSLYGGSLSNISFPNSSGSKTADQKSSRLPIMSSVNNKGSNSAKVCRNSAPYLSERSQSLTQLGVSERISTAGVADTSTSGGIAQRKTSLNVINEERRIGCSRLKGLVIPKTYAEVGTNQSPIDLPTIRSNCSNNIKYRSLSLEANPEYVADNSSFTEKTKTSSSPPWRNSSCNVPTYSPAFKRKNIKLYSLSGSLNALPPTSNSPSRSKLGGSNVDISEHVKTTVSRLNSSSTREPLKRSSSLNCQSGDLKGRIYRKSSDNVLSGSSHSYSPCPEDIGSSTQTLVSEPTSGVNDGSTISEQRRSPMNVSEKDLSSTSSRFSSCKDQLTRSERKSIDNSCLTSLRPSAITHTNVAKTFEDEKAYSNSSLSCPRILHDTAWMKTAQPNRSTRLSETGDLLRLKRVKKPSVKLLTERWQQLSDSSDGDKSAQTSPTAECEAKFNDCSRLKDQSILPAQVQRTSLNSENRCLVDVVDKHRDAQRIPRTSNNKLDEYSDFHRQEPSHQLTRPQCYGETDELAYSLNAYLSGMNDLCGQSPIDSDLADLSRLGHSPRSSTSSSSDNSVDSGGSSGGAGSSLLDLLTSNFRRSSVTPASTTAASSTSVGVSELRQDLDSRQLCPDIVGHTLGHTRMSSVDSTTSDDSIFCHPINNSNGFMSSLMGPGNGSVTSLLSAANGSMSSLISGSKDHYGSISSLASSTSLISPHELQLLIDDANQSLEEAGTPSHEIIVAVLHREIFGGSIGITLAGGADYDNKEISVNKVLSGSVAERDGRIKPGDRILSINGKSMKGLSHMDALKTLKSPRTEVVFVVSRARSVTPLDIISGSESGNGCSEGGGTYLRGCYINHVSQRPPKILESPSDLSNHNQDAQFVDIPRSPPTTITLNKGGASIGFSLQGGKDSPLGDRPLVAKKIFTGGAADKSGLLDVGDQILAINDQSVTNMARFEAWNFLKKQPDGPVKLKIRKALSLQTSENPHKLTATVSLS